MAKLISVKTALSIIHENSAAGSTLTLPLKKTVGHVLAQDICAHVSLPPNDASAMDGYAVALTNDHAEGSVFTLIGEAPAGSPFDGTVGTDETVRIFTGSVVPKGANHVIMQENVDAKDGLVTLTKPISKARHIRKAGIDFKQGDQIISEGIRIDAFANSLLAAANHANVKVYKRPKVALLANGDELVEPGSPMRSDQIISSNPYGISALIKSWGGDIINTPISKDDPKVIRKQILACKDADIIVPIGGASVGDYDYMRGVFDELGYQELFAKIAVKPGKPTWFGTLGEQRILGLPGNPASALVCAHIFLKPLVERLGGLHTTSQKLVKAHTKIALNANDWRDEYVRARAEIDDQGALHVTPYPKQDSSLITPFLTANCFLVRQADTPEIPIGGLVNILPFKPLL